jgi:hypothetical protein
MGNQTWQYGQKSRDDNDFEMLFRLNEFPQGNGGHRGQSDLQQGCPPSHAPLSPLRHPEHSRRITLHVCIRPLGQA